jgi:hypothetical protein
MKLTVKFLLRFIFAACAPLLAQEKSADGFLVVDSLEAVRAHAAESAAKVRLKPGTYRLERASARHFITLSGAGSHWDFHGVKLEVDNALFRQPLPEPDRANNFYCALAITGDRIVLEGLAAENIGPPDRGGLQSKNKIISISGSGVVLRDIEITTHGSSPWGYGSLFGISSGDVRKMNGIRIGAPARGVTLQRCRVHMRAMGHGIFVQGAADTTIEDCEVDGLLRPTNEILAETSGYAFAKKFTTGGHDYIEGVRVGAGGKILPDEMIALSEDGIRLYDRFDGHDTGRTTIRRCRVTRMRRGICVGLGPGADTVSDCEVRECVAAGYNLGAGDVLERCRADAKFSEALCVPYPGARDVRAELEILDSRGGLANDLLAVLNGRDHRVRLWTRAADNVPAGFVVALASNAGYAFYQRGARPLEASGLALVNETAARVRLGSGATRNRIATRSPVENSGPDPRDNLIQRP